MSAVEPPVASPSELHAAALPDQVTTSQRRPAPAPVASPPQQMPGNPSASHGSPPTTLKTSDAPAGADLVLRCHPASALPAAAATGPSVVSRVSSPSGAVNVGAPAVGSVTGSRVGSPQPQQPAFVFVNGERCELLEDRRLHLHDFFPEGSDLFDIRFTPWKKIALSAEKDEQGVTAAKLMPFTQYAARIAEPPSAQPEIVRHRPTVLIVFNLPLNTTAEQLGKYFEQFSAVTEADVLRWPNGMPKGRGYVILKEPEATKLVLGVRYFSFYNFCQVSVEGTHKHPVTGVHVIAGQVPLTLPHQHQQQHGAAGGGARLSNVGGPQAPPGYGSGGGGSGGSSGGAIVGMHLPGGGPSSAAAHHHQQQQFQQHSPTPMVGPTIGVRQMGGSSASSGGGGPNTGHSTPNPPQLPMQHQQGPHGVHGSHYTQGNAGYYPTTSIGAAAGGTMHHTGPGGPPSTAAVGYPPQGYAQYPPQHPQYGISTQSQHQHQQQQQQHQHYHPQAGGAASATPGYALAGTQGAPAARAIPGGQVALRSQQLASNHYFMVVHLLPENVDHAVSENRFYTTPSNLQSIASTLDKGPLFLIILLATPSPGKQKGEAVTVPHYLHGAARVTDDAEELARSLAQARPQQFVTIEWHNHSVFLRKEDLTGFQVNFLGMGDGIPVKPEIGHSLIGVVERAPPRQAPLDVMKMIHDRTVAVSGGSSGVRGVPPPIVTMGPHTVDTLTVAVSPSSGAAPPNSAAAGGAVSATSRTHGVPVVGLAPPAVGMPAGGGGGSTSGNILPMGSGGDGGGGGGAVSAGQEQHHPQRVKGGAAASGHGINGAGAPAAPTGVSTAQKGGRGGTAGRHKDKNAAVRSPAATQSPTLTEQNFPGLDSLTAPKK